MRCIGRRDFIFTGLAFGLASAPALAGHKQALSLYEMDLGPPAPQPGPRRVAVPKKGPLPPPESEIDYPIVPSGISLPEEFQPQIVMMPDIAAPGTIVVDPQQHFLYLVKDDGTALRYGVGVGRDGFAWSGSAEIGMKRRWPRWVPPASMVQRDKKARRWANGQPGGPENPLGARALYLHQNGQDTLYRIHGTNQPESIGRSVSSGCIRMLNEHVAELYNQVEIGTPVMVLSAGVEQSIVQASG
jgi:lipoprotein-anchoring transpeptidase ErfK/SrfK